LFKIENFTPFDGVNLPKLKKKVNKKGEEEEKELVDIQTLRTMRDCFEEYKKNK
jgi:hypothetical protein